LSEPRDPPETGLTPQRAKERHQILLVPIPGMFLPTFPGLTLNPERSIRHATNWCRSRP